MQEKNVSGGMSRRRFIGNAAALSAFFIVPRYVLGGKGYIPPSDMIHLGFIGAGRQAVGLQKSFLTTGEAQIVAVSEVYQAKRESFANQVNAYFANKAGQETFAGCVQHHDFREMLGNKGIDAVVIATPDHWHAVAAVKSAEAGKDIYCEKPLSLTIREGRAMVKATRKHHRVFQTGSMQRSWPEFRQTVNLIRNGYIGDIQNIKVSVGGPPVPFNLPEEKVVDGLDWDFWLGPNTPHPFNSQLDPALNVNIWGRWRDFKGLGGGGMTDWGAHMFDIAQWALDMDDSGPIEIIPPDDREYKFLTYRYANGVTMTHENFGKTNGVQFNGSKGKIEIQRGKLETTPTELAKREIPASEEKVYNSPNHYKDFLEAMRTRKKPICDVEVGHRTATVCNLGNLAYELKRPLRWNPKKEVITNDHEANALTGRDLRKEWSVKI